MQINIKVIALNNFQKIIVVRGAAGGQSVKKACIKAGLRSLRSHDSGSGGERSTKNPPEFDGGVRLVFLS